MTYIDALDRVSRIQLRMTRLEDVTATCGCWPWTRAARTPTGC